MLPEPNTPLASPAPMDRRPIAARRYPVIHRAAALLARAGITPNAISIFGMLCGIGAGAALYMTHFAGPGFVSPSQRLYFLAAASLIQLRLLSNMLDGMVAIEANKRSPEGELYNEIPDRISDAAAIVGAGFAVSGWNLAAYAAAFFAILTAYIRAVGKGAGAPSDYGGPMAKQERMALLTLVSLLFVAAPGEWSTRRFNLHLPFVPSSLGVMGIALLIIAVGSALTCILRLRRIARALRARAATGGKP